MATNPDLLLRQVGWRIADLRREAGITQSDLAAKLDVSLKYWQRVESGSDNLSLRTLANIANALDVPFAALLKAPSKSRPEPGRPNQRPPRQHGGGKVG